jgi:hypothetical protein
MNRESNIRSRALPTPLGPPGKNRRLARRFKLISETWESFLDSRAHIAIGFHSPLAGATWTSRARWHCALRHNGGTLVSAVGIGKVDKPKERTPRSHESSQVC